MFFFQTLNSEQSLKKDEIFVIGCFQETHIQTGLLIVGDTVCVLLLLVFPVLL